MDTLPTSSRRLPITYRDARTCLDTMPESRGLNYTFGADEGSISVVGGASGVASVNPEVPTSVAPERDSLVAGVNLVPYSLDAISGPVGTDPYLPAFYQKKAAESMT